MILGFILFAILLALEAFLLPRFLKKRREIKHSLKQQEPALKEALQAFQNHLSGDRYFAQRDLDIWRKQYEKFSKIFDLNVRFLYPSLQKVLGQLAEYYHHPQSIIQQYNKRFTSGEIEVLKDILEKRGIPANENQLAAAVSEEDNTLVIAGAGTGKTTTIIGKLAYLLDHLKVSPGEILLLSFTDKAAQELKDRVGKYFPDSDIQARTFHSFGLSVIGKVEGKKPTLGFDNDADRQQFINAVFERLLLSPAYLRSAINYFAYYLKTEETKPKFNSLDEYYKYQETEKILTLRKELVKSPQESSIANFLYLNGINYIYEERYKFDTANEDYHQYKPDFYLPDYDIYIEHFGIDRKGNVHFVADHAKNVLISAKYQEEMKWKRTIHAANQTTLIETYSYQFHEQSWEDELTARLQTANVLFKPRSHEEILSALRDSGDISQIATLFLTFLDLAKSNGYSPDQVNELINRTGKERDLAFAALFLPIYKEYEAHLESISAIDFHDMLNKAQIYIKNGQFISPFTYVMIDEFQDFSVSKNKLIQALCSINPNTKLFCVGDDWQSIYRFAGSDVSLMTDFERYHGATNHLKLITTNRFDSKLAKLTNDFIIKNPSQIKKEIRANRTSEEVPLEIIVRKHDKDNAVEQILTNLNDLAEQDHKTFTVLFLGRYRHNKPDDLQRYSSTYKNLAIDFHTVHQAKGLERDYVIVLDVVHGKYGFPCEIADDPILNFVLSKSETFPHAEERRLMYVALTRTKNKVFVVTTKDKFSPFIAELDRTLKIDSKETEICSVCEGLMIRRTSKHGEFWGCSNFPNCTNTKDIRSRKK